MCARRIPAGVTTYVREDPNGDALAVMCPPCAALEPYAVAVEYAVPTMNRIDGNRPRR
jgi:hypothetical protein